MQDPLSAPALTHVLRDLVTTVSTNPGAYEGEIARRIAGWFEGTPIEAKLVESMPGRPSVGAVLRGKGDGPRLLLNGHMDTVPVDDEGLWTVGAFGGEIRDGFLYGRGACDMKAGLAIQIAIARWAADRLDKMKGTLVLHFAAGEERAEPGTLSLLRAGYTGDFGIVTEPTELRIAAATRGLAPFLVRLKGKSTHASREHLGINPTWGLRWVLEALDQYRADISKRHHPLLGHGSCSPTLVRGGVVSNAIPDHVDLCVDRRLIPGETIEGELAELTARIAKARPRDSQIEVEVSVASNRFEPAEISPDAPIVGKLVQSMERITGKPGEVYGAPYSSDVRNLVNDAGIAAVNFGPGNVAECHCADERVSIDQLETCAQVIADVASNLLFNERR